MAANRNLSMAQLSVHILTLKIAKQVSPDQTTSTTTSSCGSLRLCFFLLVCRNSSLFVCAFRGRTKNHCDFLSFPCTLVYFYPACLYLCQNADQFMYALRLLARKSWVCSRRRNFANFFYSSFSEPERMLPFRSWFNKPCVCAGHDYFCSKLFENITSSYSTALLGCVLVSQLPGICAFQIVIRAR